MGSVGEGQYQDSLDFNLHNLMYCILHPDKGALKDWVLVCEGGWEGQHEFGLLPVHFRWLCCI